MEIIFIPNEKLKQIVGLSYNYDVNQPFKLSKYCLLKKVKDTVLVYNALNKAMVALTLDEYNGLSSYNQNLTFMYKNYFLINEDFDIQKKGDDVQEYIRTHKPDKTFKQLNTFTILPTTGCNAKCFYCFEKGSEKKHMTPEIADKLVEFMLQKYNGKHMKLRWFGGEPLVNEKIIDYITTKLKDNGVNYISNLTSNGFLINSDNVEKYKTLWNLNKVSITIDGTSTIYNNVKQYTYSGNAYERVLKNIESLLDGGISVSIRINIGMHNIEDCETLVYELIERFEGKKKLVIYLNRLYDNDNVKTFTDDEAAIVYDKIIELTEVLRKHGRSASRFTLNNMKFGTVHCMTDSGRAIIIFPDGKLGLCEHYMDTLHVGDIENGITDMGNVEKCAKMEEKIDICENCPVYPTCIRLEVCNSMPCDKHSLKHDFYYMKKSMVKIYNKFLKEKLKK